MVNSARLVYLTLIKKRRVKKLDLSQLCTKLEKEECNKIHGSDVTKSRDIAA